MALPALGGLLDNGVDAAIIAKPVYSDCVRSGAIRFVRDATMRAVPDYRSSHRSYAWLMHFKVDPVRIPLGEGKGSVIVLSPWADAHAKRWPFRYWLEVARKLLDEGHHVRMVGPSKAKSVLDPMVQLTPGIDDKVAKCTPSTWPDFFLDAACVVSPDTGAVHMADAMGVPAIGLYGATPLWKFGPFWNPNHCLEADTMDAIRPSAVLAAIERAL